MTDPTNDQPGTTDEPADVDDVDDAADVDRLGYEQARDELADVVRRLEAGGASLEESLALWERGERLAAVCQRRLDAARARLAQVTGERGDGQAGGRDPSLGG